MSKSALNRMLLNLFYQFSKDYGVLITYTKPEKGDIDSDTGVRDATKDKTFTLKAVETPVDHRGDFILKLLGKIERPGTIFIIRTKDLPIAVATDDTFTANGIKYRVSDFTTSGDVLIELIGVSFT